MFKAHSLGSPPNPAANVAHTPKCVLKAGLDEQIAFGLATDNPPLGSDNIGFGVPIASIRCRQWRLFRHCAQGIVCAQVK